MMAAPHIVAVAARTPIGLTAESTAAAFRAGIGRLQEHPFMVDAAGEPLSCGLDSQLEPKTFGGQRMAALARSALEELARKLGRALEDELAVPLILALPEARPGFGAEDVATILRAIREVSPRFRVEVGPEGHAGALAALIRARTLLAQGAGLVVVLGVDSYLQADTLDWLEADRRLARADIRAGFPPGEAAAAVVLMSDEARSRWSLPSLGRVRGVGQATELRSRKSEQGLLGEGLTEALRAAAAGLDLPDEAVDELYSDINGERHRTEDWGFALMRFYQLPRDGTDYKTAADLCGDVGAATGALGCVLAMQAWARGYAKGPRALVWAGSDGGLRAAVVIEREVV